MNMIAATGMKWMGHDPGQHAVRTTAGAMTSWRVHHTLLLLVSRSLQICATAASKTGTTCALHERDGQQREQMVTLRLKIEIEQSILEKLKMSKIGVTHGQNPTNAKHCGQQA
jgi:trehalose utilization protein